MKIDSIFSTFDRKFECVPLSLRSGEALKCDNLKVTRIALQAYSRLLVDVANSTDPVFIWGLVSSLYRMYKEVPILEIQDGLDFIHIELIIQHGKITDIREFKALLFGKFGSEGKSLGTMLWCTLGKIIQSAVRTDRFALSGLSSLCKFLSKLTLDRPELQVDCIKSYLDCEEYISSHSDYPSDVIDEMNSIIKDWLRHYNPVFLPVQHGSGSVADCKAYQLDKYKHLGTDRKLDLGIAWLHGYKPEEYYPLGITSSFVRQSKYITVPKSLTKRRGISMEPATLQYFQQGVMKTLYDHIDRYLPCIPIRNQSVNQLCAYLGSKFNYYCTVDLSNASDLVSYELVKRLFKGTNLLKYLIATRSSSTLLPNGKVVELKKFAPMGSALCFPVESIIFAACCEFTKRYAKRRWNRDDTSYSVYGDDMIIDNALYPVLSTVLKSLGFQVNHDKSFHTGSFRESCGKEFVHGIDVTPLRYRLNIKSHDHVTPGDYSALCSCINRASQESYKNLRTFFMRLLQDNELKPLFIDEYGFDPFLYSLYPTNFHTKRRWNIDYQRQEVSYLGVSSKPDISLLARKDRECADAQKVLYQQWLIQKEYYPNMPYEDRKSESSLVTNSLIYKKCVALL